VGKGKKGEKDENKHRELKAIFLAGKEKLRGKKTRKKNRPCALEKGRKRETLQTGGKNDGGLTPMNAGEELKLLRKIY